MLLELLPGEGKMKSNGRNFFSVSALIYFGQGKMGWMPDV
jgi:hypothetical protein